jgi:hypothetical protein
VRGAHGNVHEVALGERERAIIDIDDGIALQQVEPLIRFLMDMGRRPAVSTVVATKRIRSEPDQERSGADAARTTNTSVSGPSGRSGPGAGVISPGLSAASLSDGLRSHFLSVRSLRETSRVYTPPGTAPASPSPNTSTSGIGSPVDNPCRIHVLARDEPSVLRRLPN